MGKKSFDTSILHLRFREETSPHLSGSPGSRTAAPRCASPGHTAGTHERPGHRGETENQLYGEVKTHHTLAITDSNRVSNVGRTEPGRRCAPAQSHVAIAAEAGLDGDSVKSTAPRAAADLPGQRASLPAFWKLLKFASNARGRDRGCFSLHIQAIFTGEKSSPVLFTTPQELENRGLPLHLTTQASERRDLPPAAGNPSHVSKSSQIPPCG